MTVYILHQDTARQRWATAWQEVAAELDGGAAVRVRVEPLRPTRTLAQNAKMWAVLRDIADQVEWPVDGLQQRLTADEWKVVLTAGLRQHQRVAAGVGGGFVMLGSSTSRMTINEMVDLVDLAQAFGTERNVVFSD